jgi:1,4-alpha-glucan branching enzyme
MTPVPLEDGCHGFVATVDLDDSALGQTFRWGVILDGPSGANLWGIPTEIQVAASSDRFREFVLADDDTSKTQNYYFTYARRLGAREVFAEGSPEPDLRFAVWAPNAGRVDVVFGRPDNGYISDDGTGIDPARPVLAMTKGPGGIWQSEVIPCFAAFESAPYMYRIINAQGQTVYRTDLFSRSQIGRGTTDPGGGPYPGDPSGLDGTKGCSLVQGVDSVAVDFSNPDGDRIDEAEFWASEFTSGLAVPGRIEDLILSSAPTA